MTGQQLNDFDAVMARRVHFFGHCLEVTKVIRASIHYL